MALLKRRIIPIELFDAGRLYKTRRFCDPRDVGNPLKSSQVYSDQDADELVLLNINRSDRSVESMLSAVADIARNCFVPLSIGGGVTGVRDAERLFSTGADKVIVNSAAYNRPEIVNEIASRYGKQSVIVSIDFKRSNENICHLYSNCGRNFQDIALESHIANVIAAGAGEIMIQSIDRDGMMTGYDLDALRMVTKYFNVPIIIAGGAGHFMDMKHAFEAGCDAVACGSLFNFGDNNPLRAKAFLKNHNVLLKKI